MAKPPADTDAQPRRSPALAAILAWLLPGLGHWYVRERVRGIIFFIVTGVTFWGGVAVGGVRTTVAPSENGAWIAAQLCAGPQAGIALYWGEKYRSRPDEKSFRAPWPSSNIGVVYAGVAGLLNLLVILDATARCESRSVAAPARSPPSAERG